MEEVPPTLSLAYVAALLEAARVPPAHASQLLHPLGLGHDPAARVHEQQFATLYRALAIALDDEMLRLFSRPFRPGALKFTCLALLDAKNLRVALHRWACVSRLVQDDFHLDLQCDATTSRVAIVQWPGAPACQPFATDLMLKVIHGVASWLVGRRLPLVRTDFTFERPAYAADYELLYPGPVFFHQPQAALVMDAAVMQLPIRRSKPELDEFMLRAPEDWVFANPREPRLALRLRDYLAERLPLPATAESAAEAIGISVRTLHRRLADEGTSFQRVKDEFRRDRAVQLLTKSQAPINRISEQLGFDSAASFHRAFRGWTGDTPGAFRATGAPPR
ncbi:MAG: AraC family transcriptional regulator [Rhizobacter sp.]|nr:AraC family transcriptional regulator [Rhizobacter sp.]